MAIIDAPYKPPSILHQSAHFSTIIPGLFRRFDPPNYRRERLELDDGDFLDLDWLESRESNAIVILCHGLEGDSRRPYMNAMATLAYNAGYSVLAWNYRGCSGESNRLLRLYHHGAYDDLARVIERITEMNYSSIYLVGFSMGGVLSLNYLGSDSTIDARLKGVVAISTPLDISASAIQIHQGINRLYVHNFIQSLKEKVRAKIEQYPHLKNANKIEKVRSFREFDHYFTAPIHGFKSADDYYHSVSPIHALKQIDRPTLVINAHNDPMIANKPSHIEAVKTRPYLSLMMPKYGGHCGFSLKNSPYSWAEKEALTFITQLEEG